MTAGSSLRVVLCNGAQIPAELEGASGVTVVPLEYRTGQQTERNVRISLPDFVRDVYYVPDRILDLLELAAYVFSADRLASRGRVDDLEYHAWDRAFHFVIRVRDHVFWTQESVARSLSEALCFMTGDRDYTFTFQPGHSTSPTGLFDREDFRLGAADTCVTLFSGGIDSLAGAVQLLETTDGRVCLVSHRTPRPHVQKAQRQLVEALNSLYPGRIDYYKFRCSLTGDRAVEESQRTRGFLFSSIAFALCSVLVRKELFVYENGVTSINMPRRQSGRNARTSRTTHPKTLASLSAFFSLVNESPMRIEAPFLWKTKTEVLDVLKSYHRDDLIPLSLSCTRTFPTGTEHSTQEGDPSQKTHCGGCYQCIDRRFAAYASGLDKVDREVYATDFISKPVSNGVVVTALMDYVRQARDFAVWNSDYFYQQALNELVDVVDYVGCDSEEEAVEMVWQLCHRHGKQVDLAIRRMRDLYDHPFYNISPGSLLDRINEREYLREPVERLVEALCKRLVEAIPIMFRDPPKDERDFNDKVEAIIQTDRQNFEREHPAVKFGITHVVPDHSLNEYDLLIESKYLRKSTTPSKATDGIAADLTKYPAASHKLFIVYDPFRSIARDRDFCESFESKGRCTVRIIR